MTAGRTDTTRLARDRRPVLLALVAAHATVAVGVVLAHWLPEGEFVAAPVFLVGVLGAAALAGWRLGVVAAVLAGLARLLLVEDDIFTVADSDAWLPPLYVLAGGVLVALLTAVLDRARLHADIAATRIRRLSEFEASLAELDDVHSAPVDIAPLVAACTGASAAALIPGPITLDAGASPPTGRQWLPVTARLGGNWVLELALDEPSDRDAVRFLDDVTRQVGHTLERLALRETERRTRADEQLISSAATMLTQSLDAAEIIEAVRALLIPSWADSGAVTVGADAPAGAPAGGASAHASAHVLRVELRSRDRSIGWLTLSRTTGRFDEHDRVVLEQIAGRAAQALDNALVYDTQTRTRTILERSLLPLALLPVDNLAVAARYFPGTKGTDVGGDFYDAVRRADGSMVLIIGDVQGKGVEAATLTAVARHTLRAVALEGASPAEMLSHLNQALFYGQAEEAVARHDEDSRFVTAAVVVLQPTECGFRATAACGGHPPPLVVRADTSTDYLHGRGPLLGLLEAPVFSEASTDLRGADTIVLYTDGVTELRHGGGWFDDVGLGRLLHNRRAAVDAEAIAQLIQDTVLMISAGEARDDIAILVASVAPARLA